MYSVAGPDMSSHAVALTTNPNLDLDEQIQYGVENSDQVVFFSFSD